MDWLFKAVLMAGVVLLVMVAARQGSRRWAGVVAALPTITAPTLAWLAHEEGVAFAISAAIGSVAACGMLAVFALGYARVARYGIAVACGHGAARHFLRGYVGGLFGKAAFGAVFALLAPRVGAVAALALACACACLMSTIRPRAVPVGAAPLPAPTSRWWG